MNTATANPYTYHLITGYAPNDIDATDLREEAQKAIDSGHEVVCFGLEERYNDQNNTNGSLVFFPDAGRVGWALNADANWMDANSPEHAIERLNDADDNGE